MKPKAVYLCECGYEHPIDDWVGFEIHKDLCFIYLVVGGL